MALSFFGEWASAGARANTRSSPCRRLAREKRDGDYPSFGILLLLFGGGGFYYGPPYHYYGGGLGLVLLIIIVVLLFRGQGLTQETSHPPAHRNA